MRRALALALACLAVAAGPVFAASIWQGVYSPQQAARGEDLYVKNCIRCHGYDLMGDGKFVPGIGQHEFDQYWRGRTVAELYLWVSAKMPDNTPGSLEPSAYADIIAYLLARNGYPAGRAELKPDPAAMAEIVMARPR